MCDDEEEKKVDSTNDMFKTETKEQIPDDTATNNVKNLSQTISAAQYKWDDHDEDKNLFADFIFDSDDCNDEEYQNWIEDLHHWIVK